MVCCFGQNQSVCCVRQHCSFYAYDSSHRAQSHSPHSTNHTQGYISISIYDKSRILWSTMEHFCQLLRSTVHQALFPPDCDRHNPINQNRNLGSRRCTPASSVAVSCMFVQLTSPFSSRFSTGNISFLCLFHFSLN